MLNLLKSRKYLCTNRSRGRGGGYNNETHATRRGNNNTGNMKVNWTTFLRTHDIAKYIYFLATATATGDRAKEAPRPRLPLIVFEEL